MTSQLHKLQGLCIYCIIGEWNAIFIFSVQVNCSLEG